MRSKWFSRLNYLVQEQVAINTLFLAFGPPLRRTISVETPNNILRILANLRAYAAWPMRTVFCRTHGYEPAIPVARGTAEAIGKRREESERARSDDRPGWSHRSRGSPLEHRHISEPGKFLRQ